MSGAAEGVAGLALSAVSVAALFTTCIQCFDIVVAGKNFSQDYEQLFAIFGILRTRFGLWGESVGLIPNPNDGRRLPYNVNIDRRDIRPRVESILNNIRLLLQEADRVDERYGLKIVAGRSSDVSTSVGMNIFKDSFERFKGRIKKNQKQKSAWQVTRWAIHDAAKFEILINRLEKYVDGLEKLTDSLGRLEQRLREEIDSISDVQSLRLLRDASNSHQSSSKNDVSDTASRRITMISEAGLESQTLATAPITYDTGASFVTAESRPASQIGSLPSSDLPLPGAWPRSVRSEPSQKGPRAFPPAHRAVATFKPSRSCAECLEEHYKCIPHEATSSCSRCYNKDRSCSFDCEVTEQTSSMPQEDAKAVGNALQSAKGAQDKVLLPEELPQNQRVLSELLQKVKPRRPLSFEAGDSHYGESLEATKAADISSLLQNSARFLNQASNGSSATKRMFFELRNIRTGNVPFISAAPVSDSLDKVLASIEGPPETPYEGGVFWITVRLSEKDVMGPPLMRFHTKIYHPNISPQGHICADYKEKWSSVFSTGPCATVTSPSAVWYHGKSQGIHWSLGALLTALCGLLASPDVEDPLVPEIAHKFLTDYEGYCEAAKLYTKRYATRDRPDEHDLMFLDDEMDSGKNTITDSPPLIVREPVADTISVQRSLREIYETRSLKDFMIASSDSHDGERDLSSAATSMGSLGNKAVELYEKFVDQVVWYKFLISSDRDRDSEDRIEATWCKVAKAWDPLTFWVPTRIDIGYGLLEKTDSRLRYVPHEEIDVYVEFQNRIKFYFATLATDAKSASVSRISRDQVLRREEFLITVEDESGQTWIALAPVEGFISLDIAIKRHVESSASLGMALDGNPAGVEALTAHSSSEALERFLQWVLRLPKADLLAMHPFIDLMQPTIDPCNNFVLARYTPHETRKFSPRPPHKWQTL